MNESETRAELIDPALKAAGWGVVEGSRIRREYVIVPGRLEGKGRRGKVLKADYILEYRNTKLAVVEAKAVTEALTEGVGQAKDYAGKLAIRFTYATNGQGIYAIDMHTGEEGDVDAYPSPEDLWNRTFAKPDAWRDRFASVAYEDKGGSHPGRYYKDTAIERVLNKADGPVIVLAHQRLDADKAHAVQNAAAVRALLEKSAKVLAVFQGHSHKNDYQQINGIHYTTLVAMVEGSGADNNGYTLLDIHSDGSLRLNGFRRQVDRTCRKP